MADPERTDGEMRAAPQGPRKRSSVNRKLFIVAALHASAMAGTAGAGVWSGPAESLRATSWRPPAITDTGATTTASSDSALTAGAAEALAPIPTVPGFDNAATINLALLFGDATARTETTTQRARWSRLTTPAGLPFTQAPLNRPGMPDAQGGEDWTDPVGILFAAETIRPTSGFARFIPTPGTAPAWLCCGLMCSLRRRESR